MDKKDPYTIEFTGIEAMVVVILFLLLLPITVPIAVGWLVWRSFTLK